MIITLHGTVKGNNCCAGAASMLAAITALNHRRSTLVVQLYNNTKYSVENKLYGRFLKNTQFTDNIHTFDFKGIDYLLVQLNAVNLRKEDFTKYATSLLNKDNLLDLLKVSEKQNFEEELSNDLITIERLLENAAENYDYIYVCLPNNDKQIVEAACSKSDLNIICVPQGEKESYLNCDNQMFLVTDYCPNTKTYDEMFLKKAYETRTLYVMNHNTDYKDADISGTLLDFIIRNIKDDKSDTNYSFISKMMKLVDSICKKSGTKDGEQQPIEPENEDAGSLLEDMPSQTQESSELSIIPEDSVQKNTVKSGFFKSKEKEYVTLQEENCDNTTTDFINTPVSSEFSISHEDSTQKEIERESHKLFRKKSKKESLEKKQSVSLKNASSDGFSTDTFDIPLTPSNISSPETHWVCECGKENTGNFCEECGQKQPLPQAENADSWNCLNCNTSNVGNFCKECGAKRPEPAPVSKNWICSCGTENEGNFCKECGLKR